MPEASSTEQITALLEQLAGSKARGPLQEEAARLLAVTEVGRKGPPGIGLSQLNEMLLALGFARVNEHFFRFLCDEGKSEIQDLADLRRAVNVFREIGLWEYGNTRYAFEQFAKDGELLKSAVAERVPIDEGRFLKRHPEVQPIKRIPADKTYYLGYVVEKELKERRKNPDDKGAEAEWAERNDVVEVGKKNFNAYLFSDHMDVYVATSMRERHEYQCVSELTNEIFEQPNLQRLNLRYFDPTQAYTKPRIDKGLSEALMLKRARCTIYLAQETDTLGKDSELASTLAQGKPVIAYVPEVGVNYARGLIERLEKLHPTSSPADLILQQLRVYWPAGAWKDARIRNWLRDPAKIVVTDGIALLQEKIKDHYDKRANTLAETHPLGIQVHLNSGVANGVLVARSAEQCAQLVEAIILRRLRFDVRDELDKEDNSLTGTSLRESISDCVYRIMTTDINLENSFWNHYLGSNRQ